MCKNPLCRGAVLTLLLFSGACDEPPTSMTSPTSPQSMRLSGEIKLVGPDLLSTFLGCLDNRWLGSWGGSDHGNTGFGIIPLALSSNTAPAGRIARGQHELALVISGSPEAGTIYTTEPPSFMNIVEPETGRTLDSRNLAGRRATIRPLDAFEWIITVDAMGRIVRFTETMLTPQDVLTRHGRCVNENATS